MLERRGLEGWCYYRPVCNSAHKSRKPKSRVEPSYQKNMWTNLYNRNQSNLTTKHKSTLRHAVTYRPDVLFNHSLRLNRDWHHFSRVAACDDGDVVVVSMKGDLADWKHDRPESLW